MGNEQENITEVLNKMYDVLYSMTGSPAVYNLDLVTRMTDLAKSIEKLNSKTV